MRWRSGSVRRVSLTITSTHGWLIGHGEECLKSLSPDKGGPGVAVMSCGAYNRMLCCPALSTH